MSATLRSERGFVLLAIMIAAALLPVVVMVMMHFSDMSRQLSAFMKSNLTRQAMQAARIQTINVSIDADTDGHLEAPKGVADVVAGTTVPASFTGGMDEWGTPLRYCSWDLGAANGNVSYSQNTVAPPVAGLMARIISAGRDKAFCGDYNSECQAVTPGCDDIVVNIQENDVLTGSGVLNGWTKPGTPSAPGVQLLNPADNVGVGVPAGSDKLTVGGSLSTSGNITAVSGNLTAGGGVVATGDVMTGGKVTANGVVTGSALSTTGSVTAGSAAVSGNVTATGTISATGGVQNPVYAP